MKRLQLRHLDKIFENRAAAVEFFDSIVNLEHVNSEKFGESLFAEPMVVRYTDEGGEVRVILAIGSGNDHEKYHLIDSASLEEAIGAIKDEVDEIGEEVQSISGAVEDNVARIVACDHELEANVRAEYVLKNNAGVELGEHIKIYKDSALVDAQLGGSGVTEFIKTENGYEPVGAQDGSKEVLYLIYMGESGEIKFVPIDFERFILEAEVADGLKVTENHEIVIKIADSDEGFLVADANGLKTNGIQDAIDEATRMSSKDILIESTESGTIFTIQVDGSTIAKDLLYENGVAVLSSPITLRDISDTNHDTTVKSVYALLDGDGNVIGEPIKIYNEGHLKKVEIGTTATEIDAATGAIISVGDGEPALIFIYAMSTGYEMARVAISDLVPSSVFTEIYDTIDREVSGAVSTAKSYADQRISDLISGTTASVNQERTERMTEDNILDDKITALRTLVDGLSDVYETKDGANIKVSSARTELTNIIANASAETLNEAKDYADDAIAAAVDAINDIKVVDVAYDADVNSPKYIQLRLADGTLTDGFDASDFLKDEVLTSVELVGENLVFTWNDDANTQMELPLSSFSDIYEVASGSVSYLRINGKEISVLVDGDGGYAKTLATTEYVENVAESAATEASDALKAELLVPISANTNAITVLNGDESVPGSVLHTIDDKLAKDLIAGGLPATEVTIEDAKQNSLLRVINVNGEDRYYVSSRADEMLYVTSAGSTTNLNDYITSLENRIKDLENLTDTLGDRVEELENTALDEDDIKNIIKNYLVGTEKEIKIAEANDKLKVGFADDAVFGEYFAAGN